MAQLEKAFILDSTTSLPFFANRSMDAVRNLDGCNLEPLDAHEVALLRLEDMDPDTSIARSIIRTRIMEILSEHRVFQQCTHDQRLQIARHFDERLFKLKLSELHYMDLAMLESRLNDLIENLHRNASCPTNGSMALSSEMSYNIEPCSPDISFHSASLPSGDCVAASSDTIKTSVNNNISATSSLLGGGIAVSCRYLPNSHHRVNSSISPHRNFTPCPVTVQWNVPMFPKNCTDARFSTLMPSNQYVGCRNSYVSQSTLSQMDFSGNPNSLINGGPFFATKTEGIAVSEQCESRFRPEYNIYSSATSVMPATLFGSEGDYKNVNQSGIWINQKIDSVKPGSMIGQDLYSRQGLSGLVHPQSVSGPTPAIKSQTINNLNQQFYSSIVGSERSCVFVPNSSADIRQEQHPVKWQNMLFSYHHALHCSAHGNECQFPKCMTYKMLGDHISHCSGNCSENDCSMLKTLLAHYQVCSESYCGICVPVKQRLGNVLQENLSSNLMASSPTPISTIEHEEPPLKRSKMDHQSSRWGECPKLTSSVKSTPESLELDTGPSSSSLQENYAESDEIEVEGPVFETKLHADFANAVMANQPDKKKIQLPLEAGKVEVQNDCMNTVISAAHVNGELETVKKSKKGVSLIDSFTAKKILEHINSLKERDVEAKEKTENKQGKEQDMDNATCTLCGLTALRFDPPARYCALCLKKINPMGVYYYMCTAENGSEPETSFCRKCYNVPGESVNVCGKSITKSNIMRGENYAKNDDLIEWWVHCDKCNTWQHQICTLFNSIKNEAVQTDHTCPTCILQEIEDGEHEPLLQSEIPGAKELPTTMLSDYIEQWVFRRLQEDRQERANSLGKSVSEVPTAEGLVVRVVSSVVKQLEVKRGFRDIFSEETYPSEFTYKSKAILLFQNIDGVDVCLFGMYVQEYGSECADPNKRRVCISYIDSVKHFRPRVTAATGEALRTFVYHEILIGYLDYCKKRGFTSCYIWACPPLKRDDYILYCHPKSQKMPKSDKLREWYRTIIRKALKKEIVVEHTNLHDHFFVGTSECKAKLTAARLPYFDCDYWPGEAEVLLQKEDGSKPEKKAVTDRVLRAYRRDASIENPKDVLLMYQLGEIIRPMKEDFIMIHLCHICKHCCNPISSGELWDCTACSNFKLCKECFLLEQNVEAKDRHPTGTNDKHSFHKVQVDMLPPDTIDDDRIIQSDIFDTRLMFLGHCQNNHYQFDTLRRAKHSTMMILYNLHSQVQSSLVTICIGCHIDIDKAQSWHCLTCTRYDLCNTCYLTGAFLHEHKLVQNGPVTDSTSQQSNQNKKVRHLQVKELTAAPLAHASRCKIPLCDYQFCRQLKGLFFHTAKCQTRVVGGCEKCKKVWFIIYLHARSCIDPECLVPRCNDVKGQKRKVNSAAETEQSLGDLRQRAGAKERMRERIKRQKKTEILRKGSN